MKNELDNSHECSRETCKQDQTSTNNSALDHKNALQVHENDNCSNTVLSVCYITQAGNNKHQTIEPCQSLHDYNQNGQVETKGLAAH